MTSPSLISIPQAIEVGARFIKPNWAVIVDWVNANVQSDQLNGSWTQLASQWLETLREALST